MASNWERYLAICASLLAVTWGIAQLKPQLQQTFPHANPVLFAWMLRAGVLLSVLMFVFAVWGGLNWVTPLLNRFVLRRVEEVIGAYRESGWQHNETFRPATDEDLVAIHQLGTRMFGEVQSLDRIRAVHSKAARTYWVLWEHKGKLARLSGYFVVYPLTRPALDAIQMGHLTGLTVDATHVCKSEARAAGFYIGAVAASTLHGKGAILGALLYRLISLPDKRSILARPVTVDGLRLINDFQFAVASKAAQPGPHPLYIATQNTFRLLSERRKQLMLRGMPLHKSRPKRG